MWTSPQQQYWNSVGRWRQKSIRRKSGFTAPMSRARMKRSLRMTPKFLVWASREAVRSFPRDGGNESNAWEKRKQVLWTYGTSKQRYDRWGVWWRIWMRDSQCNRLWPSRPKSVMDDGSRGQGRERKKWYPGEHSHGLRKKKLVLERRKGNKPEAGQERTVPPKPEEVTFSKRSEREWPQHGSWRKTQWLGPQSALRVKRRESQARREATPVKNKGRARWTSALVLTHSLEEEARGRGWRHRGCLPKVIHLRKGQEEHPYRARWMKRLIHMGPGDAGLPRASHVHLFSPMVTEIWAWKLAPAPTPLKSPGTFMTAPTPTPPLVTSGPAWVLEKHYQVKAWDPCCNSDGPVPFQLELVWHGNILTAPGWSHPHNSKNIILTPSYQFSAFPFLAHLEVLLWGQQAFPGARAHSLWAVLSVSVPWLLIFQCLIKSIEEGFALTFWP